MAHTTERRTLLKGVAAGGLTCLAGCLGGGGETSGGGSDPFRFSVPFFPATLDPVDTGWRLRQIGILETLFEVNRDAAIEPRLIEEYSRSDDDRTWTLTLREGVTLHGGDNLTADDVVFSLQRAFETDRSRLSGLPVERVEAVDDETVSIATTEPLASLPGQLSRPYAGILGRDSAADDGTIDTPIATGPFAFDSWDPDSELRVTRNESYYGTAPTIERAVYEQVQDPQTRGLKLQNGELDLAANLPNSTASNVRSATDRRLRLNRTTANRIVVFNTSRGPLSDRRVRQAALYAANQEGIVNSVLDGIGSPAYTPWDPDVVDWTNDDVKTYRHDPERAASLLEDAGWTLNDGVRRRDGKPLALTIWAYTDRPSLPDIATALQSQLGNVGFDIDVRVTEWGALDAAKQQGNFDMFVGYWTFYGSPPDPDVLSNYYHSTENVLDSPYKNQRVDELLSEGRKTFDRSKRATIYDRIQRIVMKDVPLGFLTRQTNVNAVRSSFESYDPNPITFDIGLERIRDGGD
ncbi:ABC transporter substrate-binding protein [Halococcus sp. IIIV-5B]|uniref:ABC transporter substrate-binding protein n=1 Tax=Halococcus sp. IIIV-5B TaxID=2321230 RepID=UPI001314AD39|nr:ABC transporter substrate-binding protein [Halococcus sp. IIIV-5B]